MAALEENIEKAFRRAVVDTPYCSISVKGLCEKAGASRKMFYKRFDGKGDLLRHIFFRDVVNPQLELCQLLSFGKMGGFGAQMEQHMFKAVRDDGDFYRNVVNAPQGGEEAFAEAATSALREFDLELLREFGYRGADPKPDYIATFFAEAKARMMTKWIRDDYPLTSDEASTLYSRMTLPFWNNLVKMFKQQQS